MQVCLLHTEKMAPVPTSLTVLKDYGPETIFTIDGSDSAFGTVLILDGEPEVVAAYLRPYDGVWVSNNPASGEWQVFHVR